MIKHKFLEYSGSIFALSGAAFLAMGNHLGWATFTISNFILIPFSFFNKLWGIMILNIGFLFFNLIGVYNFLL